MSPPDASEGPAGIYVHIPFCRTKCPYCSFVSFAGVDIDLRKSYMAALVRQLQDMSSHPWCRNRRFHSLYIGGGTPTSVDSAAMARFVGACLRSFDFSAAPHGVPEVTIEVNPKTTDRPMLQQLRQAGVNRLSIGVQSFSEMLLITIGRSHSVRDCRKTFVDARNAGFKNISLDLMYGLPGQDLANWRESLEQAVGLGPEHLSVYELTIEEGTPFAELHQRGSLVLPEEETVLSMFEQAQRLLAANGYSQYEISNYCRNGFRCLHNVNYWENGSYLGLGSGAVSCFSGLRVQNVESPERFVSMVNRQQKPFSGAEFLSLTARFRETVIMGLRMLDGVAVSRLEERYGLTPGAYYGENLQFLLSQGLLEIRQGRLRLTKRGIPLANRVMVQLV